MLTPFTPRATMVGTLICVLIEEKQSYNLAELFNQEELCLTIRKLVDGIF